MSAKLIKSVKWLWKRNDGIKKLVVKNCSMKEMLFIRRVLYFSSKRKKFSMKKKSNENKIKRLFKLNLQMEFDHWNLMNQMTFFLNRMKNLCSYCVDKE